MRKFIYAALIGFAIFLCVVPLAFYEILPAALNSKILPDLAETYGISRFSGNIRHIGFTSATASDIQIGNDAGFITVDSLRLSYSLSELSKKRIRLLQISGCQLHCSIQEQGVFLQIPNIKPKETQKRSEPETESALSLPFFIDKIELISGILLVTWQNRRYPIPVDAAIVFSESEPKLLNALITADIRGCRIKFALQYHLENQTLWLHLDSEEMELDRFSDIARLVPGLTISGSVQLSADSRIQLSPFRIVSASGVMTLINKDSRYQTVKFRRHAQKDVPIQAKFRTEDGSAWTLSVSSISLDQPVSAVISDASCQLVLNPEGAAVDGSFKLLLERLHPAAVLSEPILSQADFSAAILPNQKWRVRCQSKLSGKNASKQFRLAGDSSDVSFKAPEFRVEAASASGRSDLLVSASDVMYQFTDTKNTIKIPAVNLKGIIFFKPDSTGKISGELTAEAHKTIIQADTTSVSLPEVKISGKWASHLKGDIALDSSIKIGKGSAKDSQRKFQADGIHADLPFFISPNPKTAQGSFTIDAVTWDHLALGGISGTVQQKDSEISFSVDHKNKIFPDLTVKASGKAVRTASGKIEGDIDIIGSYSGKKEVDLGKILPSAKGISWIGKLEAKGKIAFSESGQRYLEIRMIESKLSDKSRELSLEGINVGLVIPNLMQFATSPMQKITFKKASMGAVDIQDGDITFQIETGGILFIEKGSFKWCKGTVSAHSFRILPGVEEYDIVLYCDRLHLAQVLQQLGAGRAKGDGTVNGKIPVTYRKKKLTFNDGFLYSTPGEGGALQVTGTEMFTAGIPANTPQFDQIDLAREALKEFDYTWAKLGLTTQGDDLKLRLQFDGKPANPLPFVYRKEIGGFSRVEADSPGSIFQGIRLDVNIGLPLDSILKYKDMIKQFKP